MQDYRKLYEKILGIKIPKGYVIHHIDLNRNNNNFNNLVMLPEELHLKYHSMLEKYKVLEKKFNTEITSINGVGHNDYLLFELIKFNEIYKLCCMWFDYKNCLLAIIPNIHNIEVDYGNI